MPSTPARDARILLFGPRGQLGRELLRELQGLGRVIPVDRRDVDLEDTASIAAVVERQRPSIIVNAAAYTAVDAAETDRARCMRVNADAPGALARAAAGLDALLVHYSTNYVFDGRADRPYREDDPVAPLGVYGESKLLGEQAVAAEQGRHLILRTSGVYGWTGTNFMLRMLELAHDREELRVVRDQLVSPTPAASIAEATARALGAPGVDHMATLRGTYHLTTTGATSWFEFARAVLVRDPRRDRQRCRLLLPITSEEFVTPARRPMNGVLDSSRFVDRFGFGLGDWEAELDRVFAGAPNRTEPRTP